MDATLGPEPAEGTEKVDIIEEMYNAIEDADSEKMQKLIAAGTHLEKDREGDMMRLAVDKSSADVVKLLIEAGFEVKNEHLLPRACDNHRPISILKVLIEAGADVNQLLEPERFGPVIAFAWGSSSELRECVKMLIEAGADVNGGGDKPCNITPLLAYVYKGDEEMVDYMIAAGADVNQRVDGHSSRASHSLAGTHLGVAAQIGRTAVVKKLIAAGAVVKDSYSRGLPCWYGCRLDDMDMIDALLTNRADVNEANERGETPLFHVLGRFKRGYLFKKCDHELWSGHYCQDIVRVFIDAGADVNSSDNLGQSLLHEVRCGVCASLLIAAGADVNALDKNRNTPLHVAAMFGSHNVIKALLEIGADLHVKNCDGQTALSCAVGQGQRLHETLHYYSHSEWAGRRGVQLKDGR